MTTSHDWDSGSNGSQTFSQQNGTDTVTDGTIGESSDTKEHAKQVADTAKGEGAHVAETAKGEVQQVAGEAKEKAADLLTDAKTQVHEQSRTQMQALAVKLKELSGEVDSMVEGSNVQGTVTELARQLSDKIRALSSQLADREPKELLEDVRGFARQRPGTFLAGALATGVVAGRLTRGVKQAHDSDGEPSTTTPDPASGQFATGNVRPTSSRVPTEGGSGVGAFPESESDRVAGQNVGGRL